MIILSIDPGNIDSAYIFWDGKSILQFGKVTNEELLDIIKYETFVYDEVVVEMIASYGMPVGKEVFDTCVWIGRFVQECENRNKYHTRAFRNAIKNHLCHSSKAKDSNVICSLVDRFSDVNKHGKYGKGTLKDKGFFFGFSADIWQAFAVAVYYYDKFYSNKF